MIKYFFTNPGWYGTLLVSIFLCTCVCNFAIIVYLSYDSALIYSSKVLLLKVYIQYSSKLKSTDCSPLALLSIALLCDVVKV